MHESRKNKVDINSVVMNKIRTGEIKIKPRIYFITGSVAVITGLILSSISVIFLINLIFFLSRAHGPMRDFRLDAILASLPIWVPVLAVVAVVGGIILLKKYDFSYQKNFSLILAVSIFVLIGTAWILDYSHLNDLWFKRGPMRQYFNTSTSSADTKFQRGNGTRWNVIQN